MFVNWSFSYKLMIMMTTKKLTGIYGWVSVGVLGLISLNFLYYGVIKAIKNMFSASYKVTMNIGCYYCVINMLCQINGSIYLYSARWTSSGAIF